MSQSLEDKVREENFHYYEVVFKADDDLNGLRTEGAHFSSPSLSHLQSDDVWRSQRANHQLVIFVCLTFGFGTFRDDFRPPIGNAMAFSRAALRRFEWEPPILIDLPNCAAVDTELQVSDALIEV